DVSFVRRLSPLLHLDILTRQRWHNIVMNCQFCLAPLGLLLRSEVAFHHLRPPLSVHRIVRRFVTQYGPPINWRERGEAQDDRSFLPTGRQGREHQRLLPQAVRAEPGLARISQQRRRARSVAEGPPRRAEGPRTGQAESVQRQERAEAETPEQTGKKE